MSQRDIELFIIDAMTGCTCCRDENHHRGPYRSQEDAERRINYYLHGDYWPLASQYARRGRYSIHRHAGVEVTLGGVDYILDINEDRIIRHGFIEVADDGSISIDPDDEILWY